MAFSDFDMIFQRRLFVDSNQQQKLIGTTGQTSDPSVAEQQVDQRQHELSSLLKGRPTPTKWDPSSGDMEGNGCYLTQENPTTPLFACG